MKLPNIKTVANLRSSIETTINQIGTIQKRTHNEAIACVHQFFHPEKQNADWIRIMVESYNPMGGSFRIQALISWFETFAGVRIVVDAKTGKASVTKDKKWKGNRDAEQLSLCKDNPYYKWAKPENPLNTPEIPESTITILARGLATGTIKEEEINAFAATLLDKAKEKAAKDAKVLDFKQKFEKQHKEKEEEEEEGVPEQMVG